MHKKIAFILLLGIVFNCKNETASTEKIITNSSEIDYTQFVNPFIGTSKMGHVFPGATAPFGMVQLSPQTNFEVMHNEDGSYNVYEIDEIQEDC